MNRTRVWIQFHAIGKRSRHIRHRVGSTGNDCLESQFTILAKLLHSSVTERSDSSGSDHLVLQIENMISTLQFDCRATIQSRRSTTNNTRIPVTRCPRRWIHHRHRVRNSSKWSNCATNASVAHVDGRWIKELSVLFIADKQLQILKRSASR